MPKLIVIYDPTDRLSVGGHDPGYLREAAIREASLSIKGNMDGRDIYTLARKLAELLLEQL